MHPPRRDARLMCAGPSDINFDQFIERESFFPLLIYKQFVGGILKLCKHPVSHQSLFETALLIHIFKVHNLMSFDMCLQL